MYSISLYFEFAAGQMMHDFFTITANSNIERMRVLIACRIFYFPKPLDYWENMIFLNFQSGGMFPPSG